MRSFLGERRFSVTPETPLVFVHLFKCAGTSVHDYLTSVFPCEAFFPGRHVEDYDKIVPGYLVYSGHMKLRQWNEVPVKPHFVTWLRHPLERAISAYYFIKVLQDTYVTSSLNRAWLEDVRKKSFAEYVHSDDEHIRSNLRNGMSRMLCPTDKAEQGADWRLAWTARAALKRFAYIGIAERTNECLDHLARRFGLPPPTREFRSNTYAENSRNASRDVAGEQPVTPEIRAAIKRQARADFRVYRRAMALSARMT